MKKNALILILSSVIFLLTLSPAFAIDPGHELWLSYQPVSNSKLKTQYAKQFARITLAGSKYDTEISEELTHALQQMIGIKPIFTSKKGVAVHMSLTGKANELGAEGYKILNDENGILLQAANDAGLLYGTFHLIRLIQCGEKFEQIHIKEVPAYNLRLLNHWDNLNGSIERGYAGNSLWKWEELPEKPNHRYKEYARFNASIGINSVVLNNVNSDPRILRSDYLAKVAALANIFRHYNIRVYLAANFSSPMKPSATPDKMKAWGGVGNLDTANPKDPRVQAWWKAKADEIYKLIPDFGGLLVKANSEGMAGPQDYGCTHADGANLLARALKPHGGIVMWRTFVYNPNLDKDRMKRSYLEFKPLDGKFDSNVILQTKNGPLDFQSSEPVQPLFGAMPHSQMMPELQITQEYMGHATYLVYLLPMWKTILNFDTHCAGNGSTVAHITEGKIYPQHIRAIAGVANTGDLPNWTGHHFAQANWYAFGRLAWNPDQSSEQITREWIHCTWHTDDKATAIIEDMMMPTWKAFMSSNSPYGLGLTVDVTTHYRADFKKRAGREWKADSKGIGTDRSDKGSNFVSQYFEPNRSLFNDPATCPEMWLLSYHYLPWTYKMSSGRTLHDEFFEGLDSGPALAQKNIQRWKSLQGKIDRIRYTEVLSSLTQELKDASLFRDQAVKFFASKSVQK